MSDPADPLAGTTCPSGPDGQIGPPGRIDPPAKPKRGRPRCSEEPCTSLSVWLPTTAQDRILALAKARRQSQSEFLRDVLLALFLR